MRLSGTGNLFVESFDYEMKEPDFDLEPDQTEDVIECPHCGYKMTFEEYEQVCDCGCPSCRRAFEYDENL